MGEKSKFSNKLGFVLAAAGSAVGLGNIWRFPYLAAKYGGGAFLIIYLIFVVTFGFSVMITEVSIGRKTGASPIKAFYKLNKKYTFIGVLAALVAFLILLYRETPFSPAIRRKPGSLLFGRQYLCWLPSLWSSAGLRRELKRQVKY